MVPRWLPGSEKEPFGVTLGCLFEVFFVWLFMQHVMSFFKLVVTWGLIFLIKDCQYNAFTQFFYDIVLFICLSLLCWRGRGRAARQGSRPLELLGHASTKSSFASVSAQLVNAAVVKQLFLQCSSLERASRSLAKTGLFFVFFSFFFLCFFSVRFLGVLEGTFGVRRVLWVSFGTHFGVIFVTF